MDEASGFHINRCNVPAISLYCSLLCSPWGPLAVWKPFIPQYGIDICADTGIRYILWGEFQECAETRIFKRIHFNRKTCKPCDIDCGILPVRNPAGRRVLKIHPGHDRYHICGNYLCVQDFLEEIHS